MQSVRKLSLRPDQIVMLIDYSDELMKKCRELDEYDGPRSALSTQRAADLSVRIEATDEYQRLLKYILDLSPIEVRELNAIVSVGEKKLRTSAFLEMCKVGPEGRDPRVQTSYLMNRRLFESIPQGIEALTQAGVIEG